MTNGEKLKNVFLSLIVHLLLVLADSSLVPGNL
jgi:hypothetical protein